MAALDFRCLTTHRGKSGSRSMSSSLRLQKSMKISYGSFHFSFCASPLPTTKPISNCSRHLREKTHGEGLRVSVRRPRPLALKLARFCGLTEFIAESGSFMQKSPQFGRYIVRKQVYAVHLSIQSFPFFCPCEHGMSLQRQGRPCR